MTVDLRQGLRLPGTPEDASGHGKDPHQRENIKVRGMAEGQY